MDPDEAARPPARMLNWVHLTRNCSSQTGLRFSVAAQGLRLCRRLDGVRAEPAARALLRSPAGEQNL